MVKLSIDQQIYCGDTIANGTFTQFALAWNGNRLISRKESVCEWGEPLPNQCFAFGREKIGPYKEREDATTEGRLDTDQCRAACCANKDCDSWQEMPGRGCYFGTCSVGWLVITVLYIDLYVLIYQ